MPESCDRTSTASSRSMVLRFFVRAIRSSPRSLIRIRQEDATTRAVEKARHCRCHDCRSADRAIATGNPSKWAESMIRSRPPSDCLWTATSRMPWRIRTSPAATVTATRWPISRHRPSSCSRRSRLHSRCRRREPVRAIGALSGRAVDTHVRHLTLPLGEMRLEYVPAREGMPRDRVLLHVADTILRLTLRARPTPRAGPRREPRSFANAMSLSLN